MQSDSSSGSSLERPRSYLSNFLGTMIALLTLVLPLMIVNRYSEPARLPSTPPYSSPNAER